MTGSARQLERHERADSVVSPQWALAVLLRGEGEFQRARAPGVPRSIRRRRGRLGKEDKKKRWP
jgi:hypothetical protein